MSHPCEAFPLSVYRVTFIIRSPLPPLRIAQEPLLKVRTGGFQYFDAKGAPVPGNETAALVEKTTTARWDGMRWFDPTKLLGTQHFRLLERLFWIACLLFNGSFATEDWRGIGTDVLCPCVDDCHAATMSDHWRVPSGILNAWGRTVAAFFSDRASDTSFNAAWLNWWFLLPGSCNQQIY